MAEMHNDERARRRASDGDHDHSLHCKGSRLSGTHRHSRRLWWVLLLSGSYMVAEVVGAYYSGSLTLLADAGHMAIDTGAVALGLFAIWVAQRPPTEEKTFGYYRAEILAAFLNGIALAGIAFFILAEAWERFVEPPPVRGGLMLGVAAGGLVVNLIALRLTHQHSHESLNMRGVWLHILGDTLGSVGALIASFLVWRYQWYVADPVLSAVLSLFILVGAYRLIRECVNVLLEGTPPHMDVTRLGQELAAQEGVVDVHDLHVWTLTSGFVSLSAHVCIGEGVDSAALLRRLTTYIQSEHGIAHVTLQLEPPGFRHRKSDCH